MDTRLTVCSVISAALFASIQAPSPADTFTPSAWVEQSGVPRGFVVQLGGASVDACVKLHAETGSNVQALLRDASSVAAARTAIRAADCYGPVSARVYSGDRLPYRDNLVNLLIVQEDQGIGEAELMRVLRPLGVLAMRKGDAWQTQVKPWPAGMDVWTHFLHGPSNNAVSQDSNIRPPRRLQWSADHLWGRSHEMNNSFPALVTDAGRMYYIFDTGVTGMEDPRLGEQWTLFARDAFNGNLLWQRPLSTWGSQTWGSRALRFFGGNVARRLVAHRDRLFITFEYGGPVIVLDAVSGETLREIPQTQGAEEILADGDEIIVSCLVQSERRGGAAKIVCYDVESETVCWQADDTGFVPQTMCVAGDSVVYHNKKQLLCRNRTDGALRWTFDDSGASSRGGGKMLLLADGKAVLSSRKAVLAISLQDGHVAWKAAGPQGGSMRETDLFFARGAVWCSGPGSTVVGYDIADGHLVSQIDGSSVQSQGHHLRCYRAKATEDYLITQFRGIEFLDLHSDAHCQNDWLRGTCTYGVMPANGLLYVPPHSCLCYSAAMFRGLNAFSGADDQELLQVAGADAYGELVKGPAYEFDGGSGESKSSDWPAYRHDGRRTGANASQVPAELVPRWSASLKAELTPPVAAGGFVYVAAKDQHAILALDAHTGETKWRFVADARIDSPPTIDRGRLLFGGADGVLYCLRADSGQLIWQRRLAPAERWLTVEGQAESVWRLHGSVLVQGDLAYCTAGRSSYLDGGLFFYAVEIATGQVRYRTQLKTDANTREDAIGDDFVTAYHIEGAHSDLLVGEGGFIYMNQQKLSADLKPQPAKYPTKEEITYRPSISLDHKDYVNEDIFNVQWRGEKFDTYDKLAGILVDENKSVGERELGLHLFTTSGFLDTTFFNRTFWMYSGTWTGFNHSNLAPKSGQLLVIGPETTYALKAYTSRYPLSPKLDPQTKGYLLIADANDNEPTMDPRAWGKDKGMGFSRGAPPRWHQWLPIRVQAMALAADTLVVCGPPDVVPENDPMAAFEGRMGSRLWTVSAKDGATLQKHEISQVPVFDGLIAAGGNVYVSTTQGEVLCLGGHE